ncbi:hypothetical protein TNCV_4486741 [Trichonephila clavipes]|nr:hypothetical protein TNCV_4486741 [Trichonephila clavipes]
MKFDFQLKGRQGLSAFSDCFVSMSTMAHRSHLTDSGAWRVGRILYLFGIYALLQQLLTLLITRQVGNPDFLCVVLAELATR